jgi:hypothetical protein
MDEHTEEIEEEETIGWYPNKPVIETQSEDKEDNSKKIPPLQQQQQQPSLESINWDHSLKYSPTLWWSSNIKKEKKEACRRPFIRGIEVRDLGKDHFLCGQKGVFATEKFSQFDVLGEYTGRVVDDTVNGHYVAALEDKGTLESLGIDAGDCGNEMRFINSYLNIDFTANVTMRSAYPNTYPHIVIICTRDIDIGEEILLDYGKAYTDAYLTPKPPVTKTEPIPITQLRRVLPGLMSDSSSENSEADGDGDDD